MWKPAPFSGCCSIVESPRNHKCFARDVHDWGLVSSVNEHPFIFVFFLFLNHAPSQNIESGICLVVCCKIPDLIGHIVYGDVLRLFGEGSVQFVFSNCKIGTNHDGAATCQISANRRKRDTVVEI